MRYLRKTHPDSHVKEVLSLFEQKRYQDAHRVLDRLISVLSDKQSLKLAYLLRMQLFKQKNELDLAFDDLKMACSQVFFDLDVLVAVINFTKTAHPCALDLLNSTLNIWLSYRPQDYVHPILLNGLLISTLDAFGVIECDLQGNATGWIYSPNEKTIVIEIDETVIFHICNESHFFEQIKKEIYHFSLKLPTQFTYCRIGILGKKSLWGSPLVSPRTFHLPPTVLLQSAPFKQSRAVDIIIPVYCGFEETKTCLESVYATRACNNVAMRMVVVNDASSDIALNAWLEQEMTLGKITLIKRNFNVGFVGAVNTGLAHRLMDSDVILLNADTLVVGNWLDRLQAMSQSEPYVGTVTPISNNAELLSYPQSMTSNPMPDLVETQLLDNLFAQFGVEYAQTIPSGVGFCLYIRRELLQQQPFLNEKLIQRGYGEETEFCLKAAAKGWKNMVAANVFVAHKGSVSFGEEKQALARYHVAHIHARFPHHGADYARFVRQKPLSPLFQKISQRRMALS